VISQNDSSAFFEATFSFAGALLLAARHGTLRERPAWCKAAGLSLSTVEGVFLAYGFDLL
jgi:hypothetical protein